jgi:hypothetical protein
VIFIVVKINDIKKLCKKTMEVFVNWATDDAHDGNTDIMYAARNLKTLVEAALGGVEGDAASALGEMIKGYGHKPFTFSMATRKFGWTKADYNLFLKEYAKTIRMNFDKIQNDIRWAIPEHEEYEGIL